jgi:hypothetical protein
MNKQNTHFTVKQTNYEVLMTYNRSEVIEFEQFKKLMPILNDEDYPFVTINNRVVKKNTIIDIAPTTLLSPRQLDQRNTENRERFAIEQPKPTNKQLEERHKKARQVLRNKVKWGNM